MHGDLNYKAVHEQFGLPDWLLGARSGPLTPPYESQLWSQKQREHWPLVPHINGNRVDLGAVPPAQLAAGNVANIGMGLQPRNATRIFISA